MEITAHALIDALDSVVWYNGLGETLRKWRHANPNNQESIMPFTMYWNKEMLPFNYPGDKWSEFKEKCHE